MKLTRDKIQNDENNFFPPNTDAVIGIGGSSWGKSKEIHDFKRC